MSLTPTPTPVAGPSEEQYRPPLYAEGDKVYTEQEDSDNISGPYWVELMLRQVIEKDAFYFYDLKDKPLGVEGNLLERVPEWYLCSDANRDIGVEGEARERSEEEARKRREMRENKKWRRNRGMTPTLGTVTEAEESAVGSSEQEQFPKTGVREKETIMGSMGPNQKK